MATRQLEWSVEQLSISEGFALGLRAGGLSDWDSHVAANLGICGGT